MAMLVSFRLDRYYRWLGRRQRQCLPTDPLMRALPGLPAADARVSARGQLLALCAGASVPRCGRGSPARGLPAAVVADSIGRPWALSLAAVVVASLQYPAHNCTLCWLVPLSHTWGLLGPPAVVPASAYFLSWMSPRLVMLYKTQNHVLAYSSGEGGAYDLKTVGTLNSDMGMYLENGFVCNCKWAIRVEESNCLLAIWKLDVDFPLSDKFQFRLEFRERSTGEVKKGVPCTNVDSRAMEEVNCRFQWVDFTDGGEDEAALCVAKGKKEGFLLVIDILKTYQTGRLFVKERYRGYRRLEKKILCSYKYPVIVSLPRPPEGSPCYELRSLKPHKTLRKCQSQPHKVDSRHFMEVSSKDRTWLEVFSTEDLQKPCHVFRNDSWTSFVCSGDGFIAFLDEEQRIEIADALSGTVIVSIPVPPDYQDDTFQFGS
ncbi:hypothetical protein Pelo_2149 [Pelomyxa schiedti]|nr:hypothetical protein Pelo_2149 [Pelomyxa schiedti]